NVASRGAKRSARGHEVFAFESNQAFANWLRGTHDQGIELVQCLAVGADRTLPGAEQNPNRLSIAALSRNRVMFSSQGFASDLDSAVAVFVGVDSDPHPQIPLHRTASWCSVQRVPVVT